MSVTETVLIADDDPDIVRFVRVNLNLEGFDVHGVSSGEEAIVMARDVRPDCVILDVMMPAMDGYKVCRALRDDPRTSHCAIIMLTAKSLSADKVEGFSSGADDYVAKPFDPPELVARVKSTMRRRREMRETSPLTGLPGNFAISRELEIRIREDPQDFAVVHADLDNFKAFNDYYGFVRGDQAIQFTASVIHDAVAGIKGVFLGHIGGDDFVVVCSPGDADALCQELVAQFDARVGSLYEDVDRTRGVINLVDRNGRSHSYPLLSISVGVAQSPGRRFENQAEAAAVATEMKNFAKRRSGSAYEIDRRQSGLPPAGPKE
jgi:diguanylate cyclase (GGDEF)-like protein